MAASTSSSPDTKLLPNSTSEGYSTWRKKMLKLLIGWNLMGFVDGSLSPPPETAREAHREWQRMDRFVKNWIVDTLSRQLILVITEDRISSSRDVWLRLDAKFGQPSSPHNIKERFQVCQNEDYKKLLHDSLPTYYKTWKESMLDRLTKRSLNGFVLPQPPETTSQADPEWQRMDGLVKNWIADALSSKLVAVVIANRTSRDVWSRLEEMFLQPSSLPTITEPFQVKAEEDGGSMLIPSKLYQSALSGDWERTRAMLEKVPEAQEASSLPTKNTALHIAVGTGKEFSYLRNLVWTMTDESLAVRDNLGNNALHVAAVMGNLEAAMILVDKSPDLLSKMDNMGFYPVLLAAQYGHRLIVEFFISRTEDPAPYDADKGILLVMALIDTSLLDIALDLIETHPDLATRRHSSGYSVLTSIALNFAAFESGARFSFWQPLIYSGIKLEQAAVPSEDNPRGWTMIYREFGRWPRVAWTWLINQAIRRLVPQAKWIHEQKVMHDQAVTLLNCVLKYMETLTEAEAEALPIYGEAFLKAVELGVHEVIEAIVIAAPLTIFTMETTSMRKLFDMAVENHSEKVFSLIYRLSGFKYFFPSIKDERGNTLLHKAAQLDPSHKPNLVSGAALQMQRELQWFKGVDKLVKIHEIYRRNSAGDTPEMVFTKQHKTLKEEGEKWMKDTATSCSVSAALIVTVMFAAAITVPGGNDDDGYPSFLKSIAFIIFAVSDAVSLFTSITSLLMFLSILTSRYEEEDFLYALPNRLCVGLFTLFISIFSMMVAFGSTIYLVFGHKYVFLAVIAFLPVALFLHLQIPLLVEVVSSTYGRRRIFGKQSDRPFN